MTAYRKTSFPPHGRWDSRLLDVACPALQPVELVHDNPWFQVRNRGGYFTVEYHTKQVIILPVVDSRAFVAVRAKRPVIDDLSLELPAGSLDGAESPEVGAARELAEETGIQVDPARMVAMPPLAESPNRVPYLLYVFRVDLTQQEFDRRSGHDDEIHSVELMSFEDTVRGISQGTFYVTIPIAVIGMYLLTRGRT